MSRKDIISLPNENLRQTSKKIGLITEDILQTITKMKEATIDWDTQRDYEIGVALAAIQINVPLRIIIVRNDYNDKSNPIFTSFINPIITKHSDQVIADFEGCLSVPNYYGRVKRYEEVRVKAMNEEGKEFRVKAKGFLARIFQHEIDHLNGVLFIDHIKNNEKAFYQLEDKGTLKELDYAKHIKNNSILWQ